MPNLTLLACHTPPPPPTENKAIVYIFILKTTDHVLMWMATIHFKLWVVQDCIFLVFLLLLYLRNSSVSLYFLVFSFLPFLCTFLYFHSFSFFGNSNQLGVVVKSR
uniref:Uncharacterized protein n=1 Tax=Sphaerodactylus townsendi TaxID=933632 RepID=A0ACB8EFF3_9SAUR